MKIHATKKLPYLPCIECFEVKGNTVYFKDFFVFGKVRFKPLAKWRVGISQSVERLPGLTL